MITLTARGAAAAIGLTAIVACGQSAGTPAPAASSVSSPRATASPPGAAASPQASPMTAAAAQAAAITYFDFYAAGQYAITYGLLAPAARQAVSEHTWVTVHDTCRSSSPLAYRVSHPQIAGTTAVVSVSLASDPSLGSEEQSFTYISGRWWFSPSDLSSYRHHTAAQVVAALTAQGLCSSS